MSYTRILLKDFKEYASGLTERIRMATHELAEKAGRPVRYLSASSLRKEDLAREIAERAGITEGLVCILTAVEPCMTFTVGPNRQQKKLELRSQRGKCLHQYFYLIDPRLGWLNVRLQTWLPFTVHIVINGREWLAQELCRQGMDFERRDNCFVDIPDVRRAQRIMDRQLKSRWSGLLDKLVRRVHPAERTLFGQERLHYYWSAEETEWATDVMFRSPERLSAVYPRLTQHAMLNFGSRDVLRFLGKKPLVGYCRKGEIVSHLAARPEGARVKHAIDANSVKMYDKQQSVLRVETTINNTRQMKVFRTSERDPEGKPKWLRLRKGVADLARRAQISQATNERYLSALATAEVEATLSETASRVCHSTRWKGRSVRALNPLAQEDATLLEAVGRGEFILNGFRNRDLRMILFGNAKSASAEKSQMAKVTRLIRLLRAHGILHKIPKSHRYRVSEKGREIITAILAARKANTNKLLQVAA